MAQKNLLLLLNPGGSAGSAAAGAENVIQNQNLSLVGFGGAQASSIPGRTNVAVEGVMTPNLTMLAQNSL